MMMLSMRGLVFVLSWRSIYTYYPWGHCVSWKLNSFTTSSFIIIRVFCPRAGPSLQAQEPRLQFCRRQDFHHKLRNQGCTFNRNLIGAVASRCFLHHTLSLASEQTLKDLKRSQWHHRIFQFPAKLFFKFSGQWFLKRCYSYTKVIFSRNPGTAVSSSVWSRLLFPSFLILNDYYIYRV